MGGSMSAHLKSPCNGKSCELVGNSNEESNCEIIFVENVNWSHQRRLGESQFDGQPPRSDRSASPVVCDRP